MSSSQAPILESMRNRRVVRNWTDRPLAASAILKIIRVACWAPAAGNRRVQRYVVVSDPQTLGLIRAVSPGISGRPAAVVVICIDLDRAARIGARSDALLYLDIGTAVQNMLLAAHAGGIGAGPVTSFSAEAVRVLLRMPRSLSPAVMVTLGYPAQEKPLRRVRPDRPLRLEELVHWERFDRGAVQSDGPAMEAPTLSHTTIKEE